LEKLARHQVRATFFIVADVAERFRQLIRDIHRAGHEVASHGWDHQRLHRLTPASFREDLRRSKDSLEDITGEAVLGFRAPTFSLMACTSWAVDILAASGIQYDSSIFPVRHDRYGVPRAPRTPFRLSSGGQEVLEIPPLTWRLLGCNIPVGGGGYFRLLPLKLIEWASQQVHAQGQPPVTMLYFHPWEFDSTQTRLPLKAMSSWRTYVGIAKNGDRLDKLLGRHRFVRAVDLLDPLLRQAPALPRFDLGSGLATPGTLPVPSLEPRPS
jgi:polysaccharide deacetylase family protein (PEP-CTERM system associated)